MIDIIINPWIDLVISLGIIGVLLTVIIQEWRRRWK